MPLEAKRVYRVVLYGGKEISGHNCRPQHSAILGHGPYGAGPRPMVNDQTFESVCLRGVQSSSQLLPLHKILKFRFLLG